MDSALLASYIASSAVALAFGAFALVVARRINVEKQNDTEFFLSARKTASTFLLVWSFYGMAVGSCVRPMTIGFVLASLRVLFTPATYAYFAGVVGLAAYAFSAALPLVLVPFLGARLQKEYPDVLSLGDFVQWRFGTTFRVYVSLLMVFTMVSALTAEYVGIGDFFGTVLGANRIYVVLLVGCVALIYTVVGGLYVSLVTDRVQSLFSILLIIILTVYTAVNFRPHVQMQPISLDFPVTVDETGAEIPGVTFYQGWTSWIIMPLSLFAATVFSEAPWQRVWASVDDRSLRIGSIIGSVLVMITVFVFGFGGFLAVWGGYYTETSESSNVLLFKLLAPAGTQATGIFSDRTPLWVLLIVTALSVTMSMSAVDSFQNGLTNTLASALLAKKPLSYSRALVVAINIPVMALGCVSGAGIVDIKLLKLFLLGNMLTTASVVPVLSGLWIRGVRFINQWTALFGTLSAHVSVLAYGATMERSFTAGLVRCYFTEAYDVWAFLVAVVGSLLGMLLFAGVQGATCGFPDSEVLRCPRSKRQPVLDS